MAGRVRVDGRAGREARRRRARGRPDRASRRARSSSPAAAASSRTRSTPSVSTSPAPARWTSAPRPAASPTACCSRGAAERVIALDVGYGQLDWSLRRDPRVHVIERTNARHLAPDDAPVRARPRHADLSFIGVGVVWPAVAACLAPDLPRAGDRQAAVRGRAGVGSAPAASCATRRCGPRRSAAWRRRWPTPAARAGRGRLRPARPAGNRESSCTRSGRAVPARPWTWRTRSRAPSPPDAELGIAATPGRPAQRVLLLTHRSPQVTDQRAARRRLDPRRTRASRCSSPAEEVDKHPVPRRPPDRGTARAGGDDLILVAGRRRQHAARAGAGGRLGRPGDRRQLRPGRLPRVHRARATWRRPAAAPCRATTRSSACRPCGPTGATGEVQRGQRPRPAAAEGSRASPTSPTPSTASGWPRPLRRAVCSTPVGSTAYNLAAGGPTVSWRVRCFVISFIAAAPPRHPPAGDRGGGDPHGHQRRPGRRRATCSPTASGSGRSARGGRSRSVSAAARCTWRTFPEASFFRRYREKFGTAVIRGAGDPRPGRDRARGARSRRRPHGDHGGDRRRQDRRSPRRSGCWPAAPADARAVRPGARHALVQATLEAARRASGTRWTRTTRRSSLRELAEDEREVVLARRVPAEGRARALLDGAGRPARRRRRAGARRWCASPASTSTGGWSARRASSPRSTPSPAPTPSRGAERLRRAAPAACAAPTGPWPRRGPPRRGRAGARRRSRSWSRPSEAAAPGSGGGACAARRAGAPAPRRAARRRRRRGGRGALAAATPGGRRRRWPARPRGALDALVDVDAELAGPHGDARDAEAVPPGGPARPARLPGRPGGRAGPAWTRSRRAWRPTRRFAAATGRARAVLARAEEARAALAGLDEGAAAGSALPRRARGGCWARRATRPPPCAPLRAEAAPRLAEAVAAELADLAMPRRRAARRAGRGARASAARTASRLWLRANPGLPEAPLADGASGVSSRGCCSRCTASRAAADAAPPGCSTRSTPASAASPPPPSAPDSPPSPADAR